MEDERPETVHGSRARILIVGAGFGGLAAAQALRDERVSITLIDRRNHHLFQPLLYQVATAALSPADIAVPIRSLVRSHRNTEVVLGELIGVDKEARRARVRELFVERTIPYDHLIVATGAEHSYFGHEDWQPLAPGLKGIEDATRIRHRVLAAFEAAEQAPDRAQSGGWLTFVVVGGGATGVEVAGALAELASRVLVRDFRHIRPDRARVLLVEMGPRILPSFPEELADKATQALQGLGVEVRTGAAVSRIAADAVYIGDERIAARTVVWAAGVRASGAARWLGARADKAGRVIVERDCSLPGHPEIFVIGDTARYETDGTMLPGVAPVAMQQGRYVARAIMARLEGRGALEPFRYVDKGSLATIGRTNAVGVARQHQFSGFFGWIVWAFVHIYYLIGFRNRVMVLTQWAWAYLTWQRGARLIVGEPDESVQGRSALLRPSR